MFHVEQDKEETKAEIMIFEYHEQTHSVEYYVDANNILNNIRYRMDGKEWTIDTNENY